MRARASSPVVLMCRSYWRALKSGLSEVRRGADWRRLGRERAGRRDERHADVGLAVDNVAAGRPTRSGRGRARSRCGAGALGPGVREALAAHPHQGRALRHPCGYRVKKRRGFMSVPCRGDGLDRSRNLRGDVRHPFPSKGFVDAGAVRRLYEVPRNDVVHTVVSAQRPQPHALDPSQGTQLANRRSIDESVLERPRTTIMPKAPRPANVGSPLAATRRSGAAGCPAAPHDVETGGNVISDSSAHQDHFFDREGGPG